MVDWSRTNVVTGGCGHRKFCCASCCNAV